MPGTEAHRSALFPALDGWYWPMAGWVDPVDPSLTYVVLLKIQKHDYNGDGLDPFDFFIAGNRIATISTVDQHLISISDVAGYADGDFSTRRPGFGEGITSDATYVYLSGFLNAGGTGPAGRATATTSPGCRRPHPPRDGSSGRVPHGLR